MIPRHDMPGETRHDMPGETRHDMPGETRHDMPGETRPHFQPMRELATHWRPIALALSGAAALVAILPETARGAPWIAAAGLAGLAMIAGIVWLSETESRI